MQLPLAIEFPETATLDSFVAGPNRLLLDLLRRAAAGAGEHQVYCWSETGLGKTHLLQAACRAAADNGLPSCYLPLSQLLDSGAETLEGLEAVRLVAIDELHCIVGRLDWERAVFSLINRARAAGTRLLLAAAGNIGELGWQLPDLPSRLAWGPVFQILPLADADKILVLRGRATRRGIELSDEVANYLLTRFPRDLPYLCRLLDTLDRASLAAQRRLTVPFVRQIFDRR